MEHNQEELLPYLHSLYKQLNHLQQQQWKQLHDEEIDWDVMMKLMHQWNDLSRSAGVVINEDQITSWRNDPSKFAALADMETMLREMSQRASTIAQMVENIKADTSGDMKELKVQQNVLNAYGGLDRPNLHSIYFDEKK